MAFYWRLDSIPELRGVPRDARRHWWREAKAHTRTRTDGVLLACVIAASVLAARQLVGALQWNELEGFVAAFVLAGMLGGLLEARSQPRARRWLQGRLAPGSRTPPRSVR